MSMIDDKTIREAVEKIIVAIGEDPGREGLIDTPRRVAEMYGELFAGMCQDPREELKVGYELGHRELVILKDIPFYSMCEHHLLPFYGRAHVAYMPRDRIVGLSKLPRIVDAFARRLQVQERLTTQIAEAIDKALHPYGVAVVIEAYHLCMMMRGVQKQNSQTVTSSLTGVFRTDPKTRAEFLELIGRHH